MARRGMNPRTAAHRPPGTHSLRSRHSRAAASAPASLPSLTVPLRVRLGRAPCRMRRIDPLGARPLPERPPGRRPHSAPPSCGCYALYRGPMAQRGVPRSGLWSEEWESPRSGVRYASGTGSERAQGRERSGGGSPPRARALPLEAASPGGVPVGVRPFRFGVPVPAALSHGKSVRGVGQP